MIGLLKLKQMVKLSKIFSKSFKTSNIDFNFTVQGVLIGIYGGATVNLESWVLSNINFIKEKINIRNSFLDN